MEPKSQIGLPSVGDADEFAIDASPAAGVRDLRSVFGRLHQQGEACSLGLASETEG